MSKLKALNIVADGQHTKYALKNSIHGIFHCRKTKAWFCFAREFNGLRHRIRRYSHIPQGSSDLIRASLRGHAQLESPSGWVAFSGRARQGEARSAKQTKSNAFRGPNGSTGCRDRGWSKPEAPRQGWHAQYARMQVARSAKQTKSNAFRGPNGSTGCRDRGWSKPEAPRQGWHAQYARMQVARSAKQTKSNAFRGPNGSTGCRDRGWSKPEAPRQGWHAQYARMQVARSAKQTKSNAFRGPNGSTRMSRPGPVEVGSAAPWMARKTPQNSQGRIHGVR